MNFAKPTMPSVYLLCGKPGAGKTTLAHQFEQCRAGIRLSADELMVALFGQHMARETFERRLAACKDYLLNETVRLNRIGVSVVLDWGFWTCAERLATHARLEEQNIMVQLLYLDVPNPELQARLAERNTHLPAGTFEITDAMFTAFSNQFEEPAAPEKAIRLSALEGDFWKASLPATQ